MSETKISTVLGAQWGDEGKGKIIDHIAHKFNYVARCAGGNNAGHTIVLPNGTKLDFHLLPSGLAHPKVQNIIGNGCVIHVPSLFTELENCKKWKIDDAPKRLKVSDRAHIVFDFHQEIDCIQEQRKGKDMLGTTKKGIGPTYSYKADRSGVRICDLVTENFDNFVSKYLKMLNRVCENFPELKEKYLNESHIESEMKKYKQFANQLRPMVTDTVELVNSAIYNKKETILVEGANATMLDVDFGTYPNVTSSNCSVGSVCTGLSVPPTAIQNIYGVSKAYCTRVGTGPFPTEQGENNGKGSAIKHPEMDVTDPDINNKIQIGEYLQRTGHEYGTTTKRARRCGWIDLVALRYAHKINHFTGIALTKLDILDGLSQVALCDRYIVRNSGGDGNEINHFPADEQVLAQCEPKLTFYPGWKTDISDIREFEQLPENAQKFVLEVEKRLEIPIKWIGVGPGREQLIIR